MLFRSTTTFQFTGMNSVHIDGTCSLRHLRHATLQADQTIAPNPDGTVSAVNDTVYTSANGDELHSHFVGTGTPLSPTELMLTGIETYDGGTGRFEVGRNDLVGLQRRMSEMAEAACSVDVYGVDPGELKGCGAFATGSSIVVVVRMMLRFVTITVGSGIVGSKFGTRCIAEQ